MLVLTTKWIVFYEVQGFQKLLNHSFNKGKPSNTI